MRDAAVKNICQRQRTELATRGGGFQDGWVDRVAMVMGYARDGCCGGWTQFI